MSDQEWLPPVSPDRLERAAPPARTADALPAASWWSRVAATLLDGVIVFVVAVAAALLVGREGGATVGGILYVVLLLAYGPSLLVLNEGRTLGKQAMSIRVVTNDGQVPGWHTAFLREDLFKFLFAAIGLPLLIDVLMPLFDRHQRALHDMACSTRVVSDITGW